MIEQRECVIWFPVGDTLCKCECIAKEKPYELLAVEFTCYDHNITQGEPWAAWGKFAEHLKQFVTQ